MFIEQSIHVAAPAARVWQLVGDPERMTVLSPELDWIEWKGAPEPAVGGSFRGHNRVGLFRWITTNVIETVEQERVFGWRTVEFGHLVYRWTYRLRPDADGCRLTERFETKGWISVWYHLWGRYPMLRRGMLNGVRDRLLERARDDERRARIRLSPDQQCGDGNCEAAGRPSRSRP